MVKTIKITAIEKEIIDFIKEFPVGMNIGELKKKLGRSKHIIDENLMSLKLKGIIEVKIFHDDSTFRNKLVRRIVLK